MEFFSTLAECSITFAGFAAVHALLQGSAGPRGIMRAWMTLSPGMMAFVLALLPQLIAELEIGIAELWQWSSVIACVLAIPLNLSLFREDIRLKRLGYPRQPGFFNARVAMVFSSAASLAFLYSATIDATSFYYGLGVAMILIQGVIALLHSFRLPVDMEYERLEQEAKEKSS